MGCSEGSPLDPQGLALEGFGLGKLVTIKQRVGQNRKRCGHIRVFVPQQLSAHGQRLTSQGLGIARFGSGRAVPPISTRRPVGLAGGGAGVLFTRKISLFHPEMKPSII
jgi:hypothetical protein